VLEHRPPWTERPVPRLDPDSAVLYDDKDFVVLNKPSGMYITPPHYLASADGPNAWSLID
jgi:23S rRNA-/tRNA-specific pseudouridylate synthase